MNSAPHDERAFPNVPDVGDYEPIRTPPRTISEASRHLTGPTGATGIRGPDYVPVLKDSGQRQEFKTGSQRDVRDGKGRYDLLPTRALRRLARHFEAGSKKYGDRNWEKGQPLSRLLDSGLRHAFNHLEGKTDEDHLIAAVWNLLCAADTEERIKEGLLPAELNDLPKI
jgi:hypothetical protein